MKRLTISTILAVASLAASAQGVLTWLETEHDFGTFNESDERVKCVLRAVNTGTEPVTILRIVPTCGCTTGDYTRTPVAVGDTATVTLTYHAVGRVGAFDKAVYVYTNGEQSKTILHIKGSVLAAPSTVKEMYPYQVGALCHDREIMTFGEVTHGSSKMSYIGAYNNSADTITVSFDNVPKYIEIEAFPTRVPPFGLCTISAFFNSFEGTQWGLNTAKIGLQAKQGAQSFTTAINLVATVNEDFSGLTKKQLEKAPIALVSNDVVDFGKFSRVAGTVRRQFTIANSGRSPLFIRRIYCPDSFVGTSADVAEVKPGGSCTVSVAVNAASIDGIYLNTRLTVITNDPSHPKQEVRLVGIVEDAGQ